MFDQLLSDEDREADANTIGVASIQAYTELLKVDMNTYEFFVVCEIAQMESFGQITRKGYVDGWSQAFYEHKVQLDTAAHAKYVRACIDKLPRDPAFFKQVYRRAFLAGKETGQKSMDKEIAMAYWDAIFVPGVKPWRTGRVDWLKEWKTYLEAEWKRGVNKDMWNQTLEFANKTLTDETLGFWSEEAAWPGVIDEFVVWCRARNIVPTPTKGNGNGNGDEMEFDS
ncbi:Cullin binding-domain-containing protein [Cercophora scortea]|uniref:Defective in cullin neddylation protein n=1 Tax=Cercophora scortea TaxID=314031 RepID=A0AAE0IZE8_9PEZI|nr:Cullin binding-domain-containing protein [Cercophora scortea]